MGDVQLVVPLRVNPARLKSRENQSGGDRFVGVAADQDFARAAGNSENGGLDGERTAAGREESLFGSHRVRHQILGLLQIPVGGGPVVQAGAGEDIVAERIAPEHLHRALVHTAALAVTGWSETIAVEPVVLFQRVKDWSFVLVHCCSLHESASLLVSVLTIGAVVVWNTGPSR